MRRHFLQSSLTSTERRWTVRTCSVHTSATEVRFLGLSASSLQSKLSCEQYSNHYWTVDTRVRVRCTVRARPGAGRASWKSGRRRRGSARARARSRTCRARGRARRSACAWRARCRRWRERGVVRHGQFRGVRSGGRAGTARHCRTARKGPLVGALRVPVHVVGRALQDCRVSLFRRPPVHKAKERDSESSEQFTQERNMQIRHPREIDR